MGVELRVPQGGAKLRRIAPTEAKPGQLYTVLLKNNQQGPFVTCRINERGESQIGPLPESIRLEDLVALLELPRIERVVVEGVSELAGPTSEQIIQIVAEHAAQHKVRLHVAGGGS